MARPRNDGSRTGQQLPAPARRLIIEKVIGGANNDEVRQALMDAGYTVDLRRNALAYYRNLPEVKEAWSMMDEESRQAGFATRHTRIALLNDLMRRLICKLDLRMEGRSEDQSADAPPQSVSLSQYLAACETMVRMLSELSRLVDPPTAKVGPVPPGAPGAKEGAEGKTPPVVAQMTIGQINDLLEMYLEWKESGGEERLPPRVPGVEQKRLSPPSEQES